VPAVKDAAFHLRIYTYQGTVEIFRCRYDAVPFYLLIHLHTVGLAVSTLARGDVPRRAFSHHADRNHLKGAAFVKLPGPRYLNLHIALYE
jgi:hypothetical protein